MREKPARLGELDNEDLAVQRVHNESASKYNNMIICHSIATGDELTFVKFMRNASLQLQEDPNDERCQQVLRLFAGKTFRAARDLHHSQAMRAAMNEALTFSIERKREVIAFDLCQFTRERGSQLTIREQEMERLIKDQMFALIERLVKSNCLLSVDSRNLDVDELFAAQQLQDRSKRNQEEADAAEAKKKAPAKGDATPTA